MAITSCASGTNEGFEVRVLVEERYLTQDQPAGVVQALTSRGVRVRTVVFHGLFCHAVLLVESEIQTEYMNTRLAQNSQLSSLGVRSN